MERRTIFLIVGLILALALLGGAFCVWAWGPDELEVNAEQVQLGMTHEDVEVILGKPDFIGSSFGFEILTQTWSTDHGVPRAGWSSERAIVTVVYTNRRKVDHKLVERIPLWDRIRAKLPW